MARHRHGLMKLSHYVNILDFTGILADAALGNGVPVLQEAGLVDVVGLLVDTAGDEVNHIMLIPREWDRSQDIRFRVHYTTGSTDDTDTITWKVLFKGVTPRTTSITAASTVLSTPIAQDTVVGSLNKYEVSPWGVLKGGSLTDTEVSLLLVVEMDAFDAGLAEAKYLLGLEIEYTLRTGFGPQKKAVAYQGVSSHG